jgi:integrase
MGVKVRQRSGAWWIFIDHRGQRKAKRVGTGTAGKKAAELAAVTIQARLAAGGTSLLDEGSPPQLSFGDYARQWLELYATPACKFSTVRSYQVNLQRHVLPVLGATPLNAVTRADCRRLIAACRSKGLSPKTIENICRTVSSILSHAVEDGHLSANPAFRLGRFYRQADHPKPEIQPLTQEEVQRFLDVVRQHTPREYPLFLCAVRTGMRLGELLGLQWSDLDFRGRFLEVRRNRVAGRTTTPKNGKSRRVDMSTQLAAVLNALLVMQKEDTLRQGWGEVPAWVFCNEAGRPLDGDNLRYRVFYKVLALAGLRRIRFHDLRHTFASLLLQNGESLVYVKEQLGHSSIQVTVDTYGHLIPGANRAAVDRLDDAISRNPDATTNEKGATAWVLDFSALIT